MVNQSLDSISKGTIGLVAQRHSPAKLSRLTWAGLSTLNAGEWFIFDGASQRGPMSRAEVTQFLRNFADRDFASVWRPGLHDWKPAHELFEFAAAARSVAAGEQMSRKRQYSLYALCAGLTISLSDSLFEWRGPIFERWGLSDLAHNVGNIIGTVAAFVGFAFIIGALVDFGKGGSSRNSASAPGSFEASEILPIVPLDQDRRANFLARYWRGEYSLAVSSWCFVLFGNIFVALILVGIVGLFQTGRGYEPRSIFGSIAFTWLVSSTFVIWQTVGLWRSANRCIAGRHAVGMRAGWATLAKFAVVLGFLSSLSAFVTAGLPQLAEASRMAFLDDPGIPPYSIRVMRNGTEAEITGGFKYGLTDDFTKILRASRQIKVVHLDSPGGRIGEAIKLNSLLRSQGMDTYVSSGCYSACTIAFAAGRNRYLRKGAVLGFHAPAFPGTTKDDLESASLDQKRYFAQAGFDGTFIDKALSTPSSEMWKPSAEVLAAAHVITAPSDGTDFAISGFGGDISKDRMAEMLAGDVPLLQALKHRFPKDYDEVVSTYYNGYVNGTTEAESTAFTKVKILSIISALRPLADDAVLADLGSIYADEYQALGQRNPALCYQYASGAGAKDDFSTDLPAALVNRENEVNRRVVETAKARQQVPAAVLGELWTKLGTQIGAKGLGNDQINLLTSDSIDASRYGEYCQVSATLYREIARLQQTEAAIIMRSLLSNKK
jgi:GYF domain 2